MANLGINTTEYEERSAPHAGPLPAGVYTMTISRVQQKRTKDNTGVYEEVEFDIVSPAQYGNRKFWDRFNIINKSAEAQKIGREGISDLGKACGIFGVINDDQDLLGKTVQGRLIVKPSDNPQYPEPKNECRKYYPVGVDADAEDKKKKGEATATPTQAKNSWNNAGTPPAQQQAAQAPAQQTPPWGKK